VNITDIIRAHDANIRSTCSIVSVDTNHECVCRYRGVDILLDLRIHEDTDEERDASMHDTSVYLIIKTPYKCRTYSLEPCDDIVDEILLRIEEAKEEIDLV